MSSPSRASALWPEVANAYKASRKDGQEPTPFDRLAREFIELGPGASEVLRHALKSSDRHAAISVCERLPPDRLTDVFDVLLFYASWDNGLLEVARNLIKASPRDWVLERLPTAAEPYLKKGGQRFRRFLELYAEVSPELTRNLARRALEHPDPGVKEAGEDALRWLNEK